MKIYYKKKCLLEIKTIEGLENFLIEKNIFKYFRKFQSEFIPKIKTQINKTEVLPFKQIKPWLRGILNYPSTIHNFKFLYAMGWENEEIINFISTKQKENSDKLKIKKQANPQKYYKTQTSRIEYWLSKGYNETDAKIKLSERQSTFSKEKCIKKYGEKLGLEIFNERQTKWVESLKNNPTYSDINLRKTPYKYDVKTYEAIINSTAFNEKTKKLILKYINVPNIETFIDNIIDNIDIKRYSDLQPYIRSTIIQKKFKINAEDIKEIFHKKTNYSVSNQIFGTIIYHNGIRFKSVGEYRIALFLEQNNIQYFYEKCYPNSAYKYDFHLPEKNIYIEYYGMLDGAENKSNSTIFQKYFEKMQKKNFFCQENDLNLLYDTNCEKLILKIKNII